MPRRLPSRRRLLTIGKWAGLCLCIAIAGMWLWSRWFSFGWSRSLGNENWASVAVLQGYGLIGWGRRDGNEPSSWCGRLSYRAFVGDERRWNWRYRGYAIIASNGEWNCRYIPLWAPFLLTAFPTALLWWRTRPPKPGHCSCGYNRAGLDGILCPECGRAAPSPAGALQP